LPYTLGRDVSGIVEKCGAQATLFQIGDEVLGMVGIVGGGYAEKVVLDLQAIARKPAPSITCMRLRFPWPDKPPGRDYFGMVNSRAVSRY
jgi:hypothetical protein